MGQTDQVTDHTNVATTAISEQYTQGACKILLHLGAQRVAGVLSRHGKLDTLQKMDGEISSASPPQFDSSTRRRTQGKNMLLQGWTRMFDSI